MIQWISERLSGKHPKSFPPYDMPADELNSLNEQIYQDNRHRSWDEVMHALEQRHAESVALVQATAEEDILDANRFQLLGGEPLWEAIAANTFSHYEEHGQDIRRWQAANVIA